MKNDTDWLVFDADDTLWDCQGHFERVMQELYTLLEPWVDHETAASELFATERKNMPLLGFGTKAFTLSMIETALRVSKHEIKGERLTWLQQECYTLLKLPATPLPEVESTLEALQQRGCHMALFTKGELLDQEHKLERSGLARFFEHVEITSNKTEKEFLALCRQLDSEPKRLTMVGNSMKSDIIPALAVGCKAVYIPFHVTWQLEHAETTDHQDLKEISHFSELLNIV